MYNQSPKTYLKYYLGKTNNSILYLKENIRIQKW